MRYHRDPDPIALFLIVALVGMIIAAFLGGCGWADNPAASESASVVRPLRTEQTTTTSTSTTTTTTVATTTSTICTEDMACWNCETMGNGACGTTTPPTTEATTPPATAAPEPPPAPAPGIDFWVCSRGYATNIVGPIPGDTSWSHTNGLIEVSQWHYERGQDMVCSVIAHEEGHLYAFQEDGDWDPPEAFYSRDVEHWADCAAAVWTGWDRNGWCGAAGIASAAAIL